MHQIEETWTAVSFSSSNKLYYTYVFVQQKVYLVQLLVFQLLL
jgi:hypothetical protein